MTLLCIAPFPWWSITTDEPTTGPVFGEICNVTRKVVDKGITGYVIEGYGDEPFDAVWFVRYVGVEKVKELQLMEA